MTPTRTPPATAPRPTPMLRRSLLRCACSEAMCSAWAWAWDMAVSGFLSVQAMDSSSKWNSDSYCRLSRKVLSSLSLRMCWRTSLPVSWSPSHSRKERVRDEYCFDEVMCRKRIVLMSWEVSLSEGSWGVRCLIEVSVYRSSLGHLASRIVSVSAHNPRTEGVHLHPPPNTQPTHSSPALAPTHSTQRYTVASISYLALYDFPTSTCHHYPPSTTPDSRSCRKAGENRTAWILHFAHWLD